jgi:hypothetical protein
MSLADLDRFKAACAYPGKLDEQAVERELAAFLQAVGVSRRIVRFPAEWRPEHYAPLERNMDDPPLWRDIERMFDEFLKRNLAKRNLAARAFRTLRIVRDARRLRAALLASDVHEIANARASGAAREARLALAASVASVALEVLDPDFEHRAFGTGALRKFAKCVYPHQWYRGTSYPPFFTFSWDLSEIACLLFGVAQLSKPAVEAWLRPLAVEAWLRPLFGAFVTGCWRLYWTDETLYWVAKPTLHCEPGTRRLHHNTQAALKSDIVNLYCWHGVMVPPFVILRPGLITIAHIDRETNAEVRRVLIERYRHGEEIHGVAAFIRDAGGVRLDAFTNHDERYGTLWRRNIPNDEPIVMIEVVNRTREPDGRFKHYWLRVPPTMRTAREAVAWTFNMLAEQYAPEIET